MEIAKKMVEKMNEAYKEPNTVKCGEFFAEDAKMMPHGHPLVSGLKAIQQEMDERMKMFAGKAELNWKAEEALDIGDYVIVHISGVGKMGPHTSNMKGILVLKKKPKPLIYWWCMNPDSMPNPELMKMLMEKK